MCYIILNHLFKTDTGQSTNISASNKSLYKEKGREETLKVIDYYIKLKNIVYIDGVQ